MKNGLTIKRSLELEKFGKVDYAGNKIFIMRYDSPDVVGELKTSENWNGDLIVRVLPVVPRKLKLMCFIERTSVNNYDVFLYTQSCRELKTFSSINKIIEYIRIHL